VVPVGQTVISAGEEVDVMQISCPLWVRTNWK
jgi:hypothetical protein